MDAVTYRQAASDATIREAHLLRNASWWRIRALLEHCGQPTGLFIGDESVPDAATLP